MAPNVLANTVSSIVSASGALIVTVIHGRSDRTPSPTPNLISPVQRVPVSPEGISGILPVHVVVLKKIPLPCSIQYLTGKANFGFVSKYKKG